ncbi:AcrR family transcriptional regulator [Bradyrhizobium sp. LM4.3]
MATSVPNRLPSGKNSTAEKLLVAASELMIERSSIEISLSDIAQKSGANAALVKYHFGNKDGLLLALLERDAGTELSNLEYLLAQPITPTAKLKLHIAGIIRAYHRFPYMNRLIHYLLHESVAGSADEVSKFFVAPLLDFHRRLLAEGVSRGEFRVTDPVLFYTSLIGCLRSFVLRPACDVSRDRRRPGHRRSLPAIYQAHGNADLRRHPHASRGSCRGWIIRPELFKPREETPKERYLRCS